MNTSRVLVIGLDGYELSLAESMMDEGLLPNMCRLRERSARFLLDHGKDKLSGLMWENVSTGLTTAAADRWSAVTFNPSSYSVKQDATTQAPFVAELAARTVVFDLPHCDLSQAPAVRGLTRWGAHDATGARMSRPEGLHAEIGTRFGPYPATNHHHEVVWQSSSKTRSTAAALEKGVRVRAAAARWLLGERLPDWDLGILVVSEPHSAIETMWHGVDAGHPLHGLPSAPLAGEGLRQVYRAVDDLLGALESAFADATLVMFTMHGMGPNDADVAGMALIGELLYRHSFGKPYMGQRPWQAYTKEGVPVLTEGQDWQAEMAAAVPWLPWGRNRAVGGRASAAGVLPRCNLEWMPAARYRHHWPRMTAFALPAFLDGRVRINLQGREAQGIVPRDQYHRVRADIVELLHACREPIRGERVVAEVYHPNKDPHEIGPTEADVAVVWRGTPLGLVHPQLGRIGPLPYRRPGGHTGAWGFAYLAGAQLTPGDHGKASSFDVVPTIIDLLHEPRPARVCGLSLLDRCRAGPETAGDPAFGNSRK
jgi:predicted AlkP superfamily phosphohydrolase/phosphomutase